MKQVRQTVAPRDELRARTAGDDFSMIAHGAGRVLSRLNQPWVCRRCVCRRKMLLKNETILARPAVRHIPCAPHNPMSSPHSRGLVERCTTPVVRLSKSLSICSTVRSCICSVPLSFGRTFVSSPVGSFGPTPFASTHLVETPDPLLSDRCSRHLEGRLLALRAPGHLDLCLQQERRVQERSHPHEEGYPIRIAFKNGRSRVRERGAGWGLRCMAVCRNS